MYPHEIRGRSHVCMPTSGIIPHGKSSVLGILCLGVLLLASSWTASAQTITWSSLSKSINLTSSHSNRIADFRFELGVFEGSFIPTSENTDQWALNWRPAQETFYNTKTKRFADQFTVTNNNAPFTAGKDAYIWGFDGNSQESEWILFRNNKWKWPLAASTPSPINTTDLSWVAEQADAVLIGEIVTSGSPYLMKSGGISSVRQPNTRWDIWLKQTFPGDKVNNGPDKDPDNDGISNLLEFAMGSNPKKAGGIPATPVQIKQNSSQKHLEITIPRRIDHQAILTVQVSNHPAGPWLSGPAYTTEVSNGLESLIVRDNTPISPEHPRRFMRLHVALP